MKSLIVFGRRWFQKTNGNTYHSAEIIVDGKPVHKIEYEYGYDQQYLYTAFNWLKSEGYLNIGTHESPHAWAERTGINLVCNVVDVARKKDL